MAVVYAASRLWFISFSIIVFVSCNRLSICRPFSPLFIYFFLPEKHVFGKRHFCGSAVLHREHEAAPGGVPAPAAGAPPPPPAPQHRQLPQEKSAGAEHHEDTLPSRGKSQQRPVTVHQLIIACHFTLLTIMCIISGNK